MRIGMIGAGWIATDHVARLRAADGVELVGVCDLDGERARALAGSAAVYTDWRELIERESPDAVFVCTPPLTHREIAVAALEQRHPRLPREADRARPRRRAGDRRGGGARRGGLRVGYQWRGVEALDALREALAGQELGLLIGIGTGPTKSGRGSSTARRAAATCSSARATSIDLERAVGGEVVAVQAAPRPASRWRRARASDRGDIEDAAALVLHFANGGDRRDPDRVDPRRAARDATRSTCSAATPRCTSSSIRLHAERPLARRPSVEAAMRQPPDATGRSSASSTRRGPATAPPSSARRSQAAGTLAVALACEEAIADRRHGAGRAVDAGVIARAEHVGSLLRPPALLDARARARAGELEPAAFKRIEDRAMREVDRPAGVGRLRGRDRRRAAPRVLPERADGRGRRASRAPASTPGCGATGTRGPSATAASRVRPGLAVTERLRRRRLLASEEFTFLRAATDPRREGHAAEPDAVRQPLGSGALARRLPALRRLHGRRRRDPRRRGARARSAWAAATSSSTRRTTRC